MTVPDWVSDSVFYQIFPDRFANGDPENDPPNVQPWGSPPTNWGFQGGDLRGIIQRFDYLLDLGINAIYLNPIFQSSSNHRYNTHDYYSIDPKLGSINDFKDFINLAHQNNVRVILDGVFNHCGRGFFAFNDLLENQTHSPYLDWFHNLSFPMDAYSLGEATTYTGWWKIKSLPKFNTDNPRVRKYLLGVGRYWIDEGIDGWRLDVPNEINDDEFWEEFRFLVKKSNPDAYLCGEIWTMDPRWANEKHFDGLMNYPLRDAIIQLISKGDSFLPEFSHHFQRHQSVYPNENINAMYNLLGSHDTERILTKLGHDLPKLKLAYLLQFVMPGAPSIYYGDEIGLDGEKDPNCRKAFPWNPSSWNLDLLQFIKELVSIRKSCTPLKRGDIKLVQIPGIPKAFGIIRTYGEDKVFGVFNNSGQELAFDIPLDSIGWMPIDSCLELLSDKRFQVVNNMIHFILSPWNGILINNS